MSTLSRRAASSFIETFQRQIVSSTFNNPTILSLINKPKQFNQQLQDKASGARSSFKTTDNQPSTIGYQPNWQLSYDELEGWSEGGGSTVPKPSTTTDLPSQPSLSVVQVLLLMVVMIIMMVMIVIMMIMMMTSTSADRPNHNYLLFRSPDAKCLIVQNLISTPF